MANQLVTDLDPIVTLPDSGIIHVIDTTVTTQNAAGSSFKITKENLLKENTSAILLNTAKIGITTGQATAITNNSNKIGYTDALVAVAPSVAANTLKVGITPSQTSAITANTSKVGYTDALVAAAPTVVANSAKVGISSTQATAITNNTAKVGYTEALVNANVSVVANSAKVGISTSQASAITTNTSKTGYTDALVAAAPSVVANTAKVGITPTQATNITTNASLLNIIINNSVVKYVRDFTSRVLADSGTIENVTALTTNLTTAFSLASFNTITALLLPSATKLSKVYSLLPENGGADFTVVRNTTATTTNSSLFVVNSPINTARISYTAIGGEGFLLDEPQRTNLLVRSNETSATEWTKLNGTVSVNNHISPDNTVNAAKFIGDSGTFAGVQLYQATSVVSGNIYAQSFYVKKAELSFCQIIGSGSNFGNFYVNFNLNTGTVSAFDQSTLTTFVYAINLSSNGYYRISVVANNSATNTFGRLALVLIKTGTTLRGASETFNGTDGIYVFGSQFEIGSTASSYIPTTTAAVTRNADVITVAPPTSTLKITTTFSNNTTQVLTTIPATFTLPEGLTKSVSFNNTL